VEFYNREFWLPKKGNSADEYEDAYNSSVRSGRFAVADGATESSFARNWAISLARAYVKTPPLHSSSAEELKNWLDPLQREWRNGIDWAHLAWFAEDKARDGAFSSLVGLEFVSGESTAPDINWNEQSTEETCASDQLHWRAFAVGDSCLFQVRNNQLLIAFPLNRAEQFGSRPVLLSSNPASNNRALNDVRMCAGECQPDDLFLLVTDALGHWFLSECEASQLPWVTLSAVKRLKDFKKLIGRLRDEQKIRNDDTTLLEIRVVSNSGSAKSSR
jgi:hypothetical protein